MSLITWNNSHLLQSFLPHFLTPHQLHRPLPNRQSSEVRSLNNLRIARITQNSDIPLKQNIGFVVQWVERQPPIAFTISLFSLSSLLCLLVGLLVGLFGVGALLEMEVRCLLKPKQIFSSFFHMSLIIFLADARVVIFWF